MICEGIYDPFLVFLCQAKEGKCEDYIPGGADSSMSPFSSAVPAATPSPAARPGSPVTDGESSHPPHPYSICHIHTCHAVYLKQFFSWLHILLIKILEVIRLTCI